MITAQLQGRRLALTVQTEDGEEPIAPFLISPMSAKAGRELSTRYLFAVEGLPIAEGAQNEDVINSFGLENYKRADETLSQHEGEMLAQCAYFWQSVGGLDAVKALLELDEMGSQGGEDARKKALAAFQLRMVPLLSQIRHRLESARQTIAESSPDTVTRSGSETNESKPAAEPSTPTKPSDLPNPAEPSPETTG